MTLDVDAVRARFPALAERPAAELTPVYFDNPAGTQVPQSVIDAVGVYYRLANANSGGVFATSRLSDDWTHEARQALADLLNAPHTSEIVLGPNMTTLSFRLAQTVGKTLAAGDEIVLTRMDHDANVAPWLHTAEARGLVVRWADVDVEDGTLDVASLARAITPRTRVVATVHASNALGTINPVPQIAALAHAVGALHVVDAVQSAPHLPLDVQTLGCDVLLCSAYKFFGPHVGVMWARHDLLASLPVDKLRPSKDSVPHRWEWGTPAFELYHATRAAVEYLVWVGRSFGLDYAPRFAGLAGRRLELKAGLAAIADYEQGLAQHLLRVLAGVPGVRVYGITGETRAAERVPTVIFTVAGFTPQQVAQHLSDAAIFVWHGDYYAWELMRRLGHGEQGMVRVGLAHYNRHDEIERLGVALHALVRAG